MSGERWNLRRVFRVPGSRASLHADVEAELEFHIRGRTEELMAQGLSRADAEREARRRFGNYARIEGEVEQLVLHNDRRRTFSDHVEALTGDVRYAARSLLRQPIYTVIVVLTLTLGIGSTAAIFHAIDRVVLRPLPYRDPENIVYLGTRWGKAKPVGALAPGRFQFWHDHARVFESLAAYQDFDVVVGDAESATSATALRVSQDFLRVVGTTPIVGRGFTSSDYTAGATPVAMISHGLWLSRFGGDRDVMKKSIRLDGKLYTIVGVLPAPFELAELPRPPAAVVPMILTSVELADLGANYNAFGRLRPGLTPAQIADDMSSVFARFRAASPTSVDNDDFGVAVMSYQEIFTTALVSQLWIMLGATAFVFLLACANVSNIVYARALARQREFAVRAALGAGRTRIMRHVVIEMVLLGALAAAAATAASVVTVRAIVGLAHGSLLRDSQLHLDARVVIATTAGALAASLIIGVLVAIGATRLEFGASLSSNTRTSGTLGSARGRVRGLLVGMESAIAMVLLAGAGLLISSFLKVLHVDGGFRRDGIYTASISHPVSIAPATGQLEQQAKADAIVRLQDRVLEELRATPGIMNAGATVTLPLRRGWNLPTTVAGRSDLSEGATEWRAVSPGYFRTMDIQIVTGRDISPSDVAASTPVVVISEAYANTFFKGENAIGQHILIGCYKGCPRKNPGPGAEIVGIVRNLKDMSLEQAVPRRTVWVPLAQATQGFVSVPAFVVRANDPVVAATALRRAIKDAAPGLGVPDIAAMSDIVSASMSWRRFSTVLMICFATLAVVLTCIGIYGVAAYAVSQRVQEIGLRMALGARPQSVVGLVVRQGVQPAIAGLVVGMLLALGLSKVLTKLLFGVGPRDPASFAAVAGTLIIVAIVASYIPARRAAHIDPASALRAE